MWFGYNFGEIPSDIPAGVPSHHTYFRAGSQCGSERQHSGAMDAIPDVVKYISLFIGGTRLLPLISLSTKNINGYLRTARETRKCEKASRRSLLTKFSLWLNGVQLILSIYSLYSLVEKHRKGKVGLESRLVNCLYTAQQRSNSWATFHFISPDEVLLIKPSAIQLLARNIILKLVIRD